MALDTARATATLRGLTVTFDQTVAAATPFYPQISTTVNSTGADEQYGWLGSMPGVSEWVGPRNFQRLRSANFVLPNKQWENSVEIEKKDIDDDRMAMYGNVLAQLATEAAYHPDELVFQAVEQGHTSEIWDGQNFFDTDHAWGKSGTQSNNITSTAAAPATPTEDEFRKAYQAARVAMLGYRNDQKKLLIRPTITPLSLMLMVPPGLEQVAYDALYKQLINGGETNLILDRPQIRTINYLTSGVSFYLLNNSQPLRPFVFQARQPLGRQMKGLDDREFKEVKFMTDARYNVGYLAWWNAVKVTFTV